MIEKHAILTLSDVCGKKMSQIGENVIGICNKCKIFQRKFKTNMVDTYEQDVKEEKKEN